MYQKHELLQDFVPCMIEYEEKLKVVSDIMGPNDFNVCEMFFRHVLKLDT